MRTQHLGMTLVELLVVVAILGMLLAVSVPLLRPMLDSRKTSNAAQVLAGTFQHARMKSIQEGKGYGIRLVPYRSAPNTSLQLRLQKSAPQWVNPPHIRAVINAGTIKFRYFNGDTQWTARTWAQPELTEFESQKKAFMPGYSVQFNRIGRWFTIETSNNTQPDFAAQLSAPYETLDLPTSPLGNDALEYQITAAPIPAWIPQRVMPHQTVVDLAFSGGEVLNFAGNEKAAADEEIPAVFSSGDDVIVMFSPLGQVDLLYINGKPQKVNEVLYFCVGEWDRQLNANGTSMAEDGKSNLDVPATYWVTLHPKTGEVRIAENAPIKKSTTGSGARLAEARKFAKEYFVNIGGF